MAARFIPLVMKSSLCRLDMDGYTRRGAQVERRQFAGEVMVVEVWIVSLKFKKGKKGLVAHGLDMFVG